MDKILEKLEWQTIANTISDFAYTKNGKFLCENIVKNSDVYVTIPIKGDIESLNLSISIGIVLYEFKR